MSKRPIVSLLAGLLLATQASAATFATGFDHTLAVGRDGTVWAWGANALGQLGDGTKSPGRTTPAQVKGLTGIVAVAAGSSYSVALDGDGRVYTWGDGAAGELGDGTKTARGTPGVVPGLVHVVAIAAAIHSVAALRQDGTVWTWGSNYFGELGDGTNDWHDAPVQVKDSSGKAVLDNVMAIAGGYRHFTVLARDGAVSAWGENDIAELGRGFLSPRGLPLPAPVKDGTGTGVLTGIVAISAGRGHFNLALARDGTIWGWGANKHGQLGLGRPGTPQPLPLQVKDAGGKNVLGGVVAVAAGGYHSMAVRTDGSLWGWGMNVNGEVGDDTRTMRASPVRVVDAIGHAALAHVVAIVSGPFRSMALTGPEAPKLLSWGRNSAGQIGDGSEAERHAPVPVLPLGNVAPASAAGQ